MTEKIEVGYKQIFDGANIVYHKYILYTDSNGNVSYARGGPGDKRDLYGPDGGLGGASFPWGIIVTEHGKYIVGTPDWDVGAPDPHEVIATGDDLSRQWNEVTRRMDQIERERHDYRPFADAQNSNTVVDDALNKAGLPQPKMDDSAGWTAPGSTDGPVKWRDYWGPGDAIRLLKDKFNATKFTVSPIILDLNGDGVQTTSISNGAHFDHDHNGFAEQTGWVSPEDGLLVRDLNNNGTIDSGRELFGNATKLANGSAAPNGFAVLAELDTNRDGKVDASDAGFATLKVWKDANGDGYTDTGELFNLADVGVQSINVGSIDSTTVDAQGNARKQIGSYTRTDGTTAAAEDVWFQTDKALSIANDWLDIPADVEALPDLAGYGNVYDLHQAIARDSTGTLKSLLTQFATSTTQPQRRALFEQILLKWTGADAYTSASRGTYIQDGRHVFAVEALLGDGFIQGRGTNAGTPNPGPNAAAKLEGIYGELFETFYGQLTAQTHLKSLYDAIAYTWDAASQSLKGDLSAVATQLSTLITANRSNGLATLDEFVRTLRGMDSVSMMNADQFRASLSTLGADVTAEIDNGWFGIIGTRGNDTLLGTDGADILNGQEGNDLLWGSSGNDLYLFKRGDGQDTIVEYHTTPDNTGTPGNADTVRFGPGILPSQVTVEIVLIKGLGGLDGDHVDFCLKYNNGADRISLGEWYEGYVSPIERVEFADDPTVWDAATLTSMIKIAAATDSADTLVGTINGDVINGLGGADFISGQLGSDTINGGVGNDLLDGGAGNDYIEGNGRDDEIDGGDGNDKLLGDDRITPGDYHGNDYLEGGKGDDTIVGGGKDDQLFGGADNDVLFVDDDPSILAESFHGKDNLDGEDGNDYLQGDGNDDTLFGGTGDDTLWGDDSKAGLAASANGRDYLDGEEGSDTLVGGGNGDELYGGDGKDVLRGDGDDAIVAGAAHGADYLDGGAGDDMLYGDGGNDTLVGGDGDDQLEGDNDNLAIQFHGDDMLDGGKGNDTLFGGGGNDQLMGGEGDDQLEGDAGNDALSGDDGNDQIVGDDGNDTLDGGAGADVLFADAGDDVVLVGDGNDQLDGGDGNDQLSGGAGDDILLGGAGDDTLDGGGGYDYLDGGAGNNTYILSDQGASTTGVAHTTLVDGGGTNTIRFADGTTADGIAFQSVQGSSTDFILKYGQDQVYVTNGLQSATLSNLTFSNGQAMTRADIMALAPALTINGSAGADNIMGGAQADNLTGGVGNDIVQGGAGNDQINGGDGDDRSAGGVGNDTLTGGLGNDTYVFNAGNGLDNILGGSGTNVLYAGDGGSGDNRTQVQAGSGDTTVYGGNGVDQLFGGSGTDVLVAGDGGTADHYTYVQAGGGSDTLIAGAGYDYFDGNANATYVLDGKGTVVIAQADGTANLQFGPGVNPEDLNVTATLAADGSPALLLQTSQGGTVGVVGGLTGSVDRIGFAGGSALNLDQILARGSATSVTLTGPKGTVVFSGSGHESLVGGSGNDTIFGWGGNDTIVAGSGNEVIYARGGNTRIVGGSGTDTFNVSGGRNTLVGGTGDNTFVITSADDTVIAQAGAGRNAIASSVSYVLPENVQTLTLTGSADLVGTGNSQNSVITGNAGNDTLIGGAGNDTFVVNNSADVVVERPNTGINTILSSVNYVLPANVQNLTLTGSADLTATGNNLDNVITANSGNDTLIAGSGNATLVARSGLVTMIGGGGTARCCAHPRQAANDGMWKRIVNQGNTC